MFSSCTLACRRARNKKAAVGNEIRMQDVLNLIMLICAAVAALAFGVLAAYVVCRAAFAALKMHARSFAAETAQPEPEVAQAS
jgi:hypothetical protein